MQHIRKLVTVTSLAVVAIAGAYFTGGGGGPGPHASGSPPAPRMTTVPVKVQRYDKPAAFGVVHHQAGAAWTLPTQPARFFESVHGYAVAYNWVIARSGALWPGRGEEYNSAANLGLNQRAVAACFAGNLEVEPPTDAQLVTFGKLVAAWRVRHPGIKIIRHRDVAGIARNTAYTGCPGKWEERLNLVRVVDLLGYYSNPAGALAAVKKRALAEKAARRAS